MAKNPSNSRPGKSFGLDFLFPRRRRPRHQTGPGGDAQPLQRIALDYPVTPRERPWKHVPALRNLEGQFRAVLPSAALLLNRIAEFHEHFLAIPARPVPGRPDGEPHWRNDWFPALDAAVLYGLLALRNPRWYVEVGSGHSTRFARRAIRDHDLRTQVISIDPCPRAEIDELCDEVLREPLEQVDSGRLDDLTGDDVLFIDSSHRSFQNSDATVFFVEILPALPAGLTYGLHDVYLPADYPQALSDRYYNEQYLLASYLAGGAGGDEILLPNAYLIQQKELPALLAPTFDRLGLSSEERVGNAFWMRRNPLRAG